MLPSVIPVPTNPALHYVFDALAWASGLAVGVTLYRWRLKEAAQRIASTTGPGYFAALVVGAGLGAWLAGSFNTMRSDIPALSHSIVGALAGAIVGVERYKAVRGIKGSTGTVFVGSFATGVIIGRWGCLFAGLTDRTYGTPTTLPWGVDLGDHVSRHPVEIYESLAMLAFLLAYIAGLKVRADWAMRRGFWVMVAWYGAQRFVWEFLKPYPRLVGPFNIFHLISLALILYGGLCYGRDVAGAGRPNARARAASRSA